jgi:hypothetical protein
MAPWSWITFGLGVVTGAALVIGVLCVCVLLLALWLVRRGRRANQQAKAHEALRAAAQRFGVKDTPPAA